MGKYIKGVLGEFSGAVGNVVGSTWKGIAVMKTKPKDRKGKASTAQQEQQAKFALMINFMKPLTDFMNLSFKKAAKKMTGFNKVFSDNIKAAITGVYPALTIDYSKIILSKGSLANAGNPTAVSTAAGKLVFNWVDNSDGKLALISDIAYVAAYSPDLNHWIFAPSAAPRNAATYTLDVAEFTVKPVQTYIGFISADNNKAANSKYTGQVNVL